MVKDKAIAFIRKCATSHINLNCNRTEAAEAAKELNAVISFMNIAWDFAERPGLKSKTKVESILDHGRFRKKTDI